MPNLCEYQMKVVGEQQNIEKLAEILARDYDYTDESKPKPLPHLWRVFDAYHDEGTDFIWGTCAWSVNACMFESGYGNGMGTYQYEHTHGENAGKYNGTTIDKLAKELNLKIEIFSREEGCCFEEHYLIDNDGTILIDESREIDIVYDDEEAGLYHLTGGFAECEQVGDCEYEYEFPFSI